MIGLDSVLKLLDFVGSSFLRLRAGRLDREVKKILLEDLTDPDYKLKTFEVLLHDTAVFDDNPRDLRKHLIILGARRFRRSDGLEVWGLPERNNGERAVDLYPSIFSGVLAAIILIFATMAIYPGISSLFLKSKVATLSPVTSPPDVLPRVNLSAAPMFPYKKAVDSGTVTAAGTGGRTADNVVQVDAGAGRVLLPDTLSFEMTSQQGGGSISWKFLNERFKYTKVEVSSDGGITFHVEQLPNTAFIELHAETGSVIKNYDTKAWLRGNVVGKTVSLE